MQATSTRDEAVVPVLHRGGPTAALDVEQPVDDPRAPSDAVRALDDVAVSGPAEFVVPDAEATAARIVTVVDGRRETADAFSAAHPGPSGALRRFSYDNQDRLRAGVAAAAQPARRLRPAASPEADVVADGGGPSTFRLLPAGPECRPDVQPAR